MSFLGVALPFLGAATSMVQTGLAAANQPPKPPSPSLFGGHGNVPSLDSASFAQLTPLVGPSSPPPPPQLPDVLQQLTM